MSAETLREAAEAIRFDAEAHDAGLPDDFLPAVADWLEHEARLIEETEKAHANDPGIRPVPPKRLERSLAVARAYLGSADA